MSLTTREIRNTFLQYFYDKAHEIVPSAPIVIKGDPTLMFTNAGMNQFKSIFVGNEEPRHSRVVDSQKCLRVSGKHNDLEEVGKDHYHHTMFEMLGNWSFGDYFKEDAIAYAWDLLTNVFGLDKDRIYVSIFEGDQELSLGLDEESRKLWKKHIDEKRILAFGRKENFWEMGETGPCGPCSEIHYDMRSEKKRERFDGRLLVNKDDPQVIEIWNLVFMQFNRLENGKLNTLRDKHIDTGMGLERLARVLQDVDSNYEIDLFKSIISKLEELTGKKYGGSDSDSDIAFRVISDHLRAINFCIADGQMPSNTGAGYVIRRVLRRAIRYGFSRLDMKRPFIYKAVGTLVEEMGDHYPELEKQKVLVEKVIKEEETSFLVTLDKGLQRLHQLFGDESNGVVPGNLAFELYDTFGFPIDLTQLISDENGWKVDMVGFNEELRKQKDRSRSASKSSFGDWTMLSEASNSVFLGYDQLTSEATLMKFRKATLKGKETCQIVLDQTPFYAESGGQVGDKGVLIIGDEELNVFDTKKENNEIIHYVNRLPADPTARVYAEVDAARREEIKKNHSATHLLHYALRSYLGEHVEQKGSLVAPDRLRFDFSHFESLSDEDFDKIEELVQAAVTSALALNEHRDVPLAEAKEMGAMALFGEKYGESVRVIEFGSSIELCGGTHVSNTSEIGGFKILSEASVASGVRRVEAITGSAYMDYLKTAADQFDRINNTLGKPKDAVASVEKLLEDLKASQKIVQSFQEKEKASILRDLEGEIIDHKDFKALTRQLSGIDGKRVKEIVYSLVLDQADLLAIIVGDDGTKPYIIVGIGKRLQENEDLDATKIVKELASHINGGGGGQPFLAMAGGKNKQGLRRALENADEIIRIQAS